MPPCRRASFRHRNAPVLSGAPTHATVGAAAAARGLAALQHAIHKIKPRPGNVFHIAGAGLFKIQDMNRSFKFLKKFLRFS